MRLATFYQKNPQQPDYGKKLYGSFDNCWFPDHCTQSSHRYDGISLQLSRKSIYRVCYLQQRVSTMYLGKGHKQKIRQPDMATSLHFNQPPWIQEAVAQDEGKMVSTFRQSEICRIRFVKQDLPLMDVCWLGLAPQLVMLSICSTAFLGIEVRLMGLWLSRSSFQPSCRWVSHWLALSLLGLPQLTWAASKWWRAAPWACPPAPSVPLSGSHLAPQIVQF